MTLGRGLETMLNLGLFLFENVIKAINITATTHHQIITKQQATRYLRNKGHGSEPIKVIVF